MSEDNKPENPKQPENPPVLTKEIFKSFLGDMSTEEKYDLMGLTPPSTKPPFNPANNPPVDPMDELRNQQKELKKKEDYEKIVLNQFAITYAEFKSKFENADLIYAKLKDLPLDKQLNYIAKELIIKVYGDDEKTRAMCTSFEGQNMFDKSTAFSLKYADAIEKLNQKNDTSFIKHNSAMNEGITVDNLEELTKQLLSSKTRESARHQLTTLGLLK